MTINVRGPDGSSIAFPDGTPEAEITSALEAHFHGAPQADAEPISTNNVVRSLATGVPVVGGVLNKVNAAINATVAPAVEPFLAKGAETLDQPTWSARYQKSLDLQDKKDARYAEAHPVANAVGNVVGGVGATIPLAGTALGARALGLTGSNLLGQSVRGMVSGAGINAADALTRGHDVIPNAAIGGVVGGVTPAVISGVRTLAAPIISNIAARVNPASYARNQVARGISESTQSPEAIADAVMTAAREGQPEFTVADAMGNAGQRMLSTVTRAPGVGRTEAVDFLEGRQAGQGRRIANALAEGFDSPRTAAQTETALTAARDRAADDAFSAVRADAGPVDVSRAIRAIDDTLRPGVNQIARPASGIANDTVESALEGARSRLTDGRSLLSDFTAVQRVRGDIADATEAARRAGAGNKARLLAQVRNALDTAMERASPGFLNANRAFERASRTIDAVGEGRTAALRGRTEDTVPAFRAMEPPQQNAFRSGYVDPLIEQTQGAAFGVNKARPLTSDAFRTEAGAMAPASDQMLRRVGRENTMFETRAAGLGGSKTADNLADQAAMAVDPTFLASIASGHWGGAAHRLLSAGANALTGNTAAVREEVGRLLLMRGGNVTRAQLRDILMEAGRRVETRRLLAAQIGRGGAAALAVQPNVNR